MEASCDSLGLPVAVMANVLILLTTYNGEKYVREMVDSILCQDYADWHLIMSDDASRDHTAEILAEYAEKMPDRITHYRSGLHFGNAQDHFMHLLKQFHDAPYIMFCDQDDIWHADKIRKTLEKMKQIEEDPAIPAMVHTDLRVVDQDLKEIAPSFCRHSNLDGSRVALNQLLVQNVVTGCTMMLNRALAELACWECPEKTILMHDWWIAILAAACGRTGFLNEATIDYRQHGNNTVGAKNVRSVSYLLGRLRSRKMRKSLEDAARQARSFLKCYGKLLKDEDKRMVEAFASTESAALPVRDKIYVQYHLLKHGFPRIAAQFLGW